MTKTNFIEWSRTYSDIFRYKYEQFCQLFPNGEEPSYRQFVIFIWNNTQKFKQQYTQKTYARIN